MKPIVLRTWKGYLAYQAARVLAAIIFCIAFVYLMADMWLRLVSEVNR